MTIKLRDYQEDAVKSINVHMDSNRARVIYQLPTGGGKTEIGIAVAQEWVEGMSSADVYWLTHREELEEQSGNRLKNSGMMDVVVSSPIKLFNRIKKGEYSPGEHDLLIADEAHHATAKTWDRIVHSWPGNVLGLTATPWRLSKKEGFDKLFNDLVLGPSVQWLIENKHLVPCIIRHPRGDLIEGAGTDSTGDYNTSETFKRNDKALLIEAGIDWLMEERNPNSKTVCYCLNVQHAKSVNDYAISVGLKSALILGETPDAERKESIEHFKLKGGYDTIVCVEVVTEGFDLPAIDSVLMQRPTLSLSLYLQMIGRAMRIAHGKKYALILDAVGNWKKHGLPEQDRKWELKARGDASMPGDTPIRICPLCNTVNHISKRVCILCGFSFGKDCLRCGTFVYKDERGNERECVRCAKEAQDDLLAAGIDTIMAAEPYNFTWGQEAKDDWGAKVLNPEAKPGDIIQIVARNGKKWNMQIKEIVGKSGPSLLVRTQGIRRRLM